MRVTNYIPRQEKLYLSVANFEGGVDFLHNFRSFFAEFNEKMIFDEIEKRKYVSNIALRKGGGVSINT